MVKTRFAPSPTGYLHIGGARTALFNYLFTRHEKGKMVLRIEDTDVERSREEYTKDIIEGLTWLGIDWDEGPYFQRERMNEYRKFAQILLEKGFAYRCYCEPEVLEQKRKIALKEGRKPSYDRTCREKNLFLPDRPFVIRFKTPLSGTVTFNDIIRGRITFNCEELDDLIILRSDNTPTYNFTVVVDDALMGITHVIRGDDHINNTPRQILIYEALGYKVPEFAHVPMILGKDRTKLSKRHGAVSLLEIRRVLSQSHLLSSAFIVKKDLDKKGHLRAIEILGAGWGHGVGMCQIGAANMAFMGYNFREILKHYFRGTRIVNLYEKEI